MATMMEHPSGIIRMRRRGWAGELRGGCVYIEVPLSMDVCVRTPAELDVHLHIMLAVAIDCKRYICTRIDSGRTLRAGYPCCPGELARPRASTPASPSTGE
eukprot:3090418-Pyramimonas_sp.AAC.1